MKQLNGIRETACVYPQGKGQPPKLSYSVSRLNETQKKLYDLLAHLYEKRESVYAEYFTKNSFIRVKAAVGTFSSRFDVD